MFTNSNSLKYQFGMPFLLNENFRENADQLFVPDDQDVRAVSIKADTCARETLTLLFIGP
jgi:hypothetical protein